MGTTPGSDRNVRPDTGGSATLIDETGAIERTGEGFLSYLRHYADASPQWSALYEIAKDLKRSGELKWGLFRTESWIEALTGRGPEGTGELSDPELDDLIATLLQVETEWRLDLRTRGRGKGKDLAAVAESYAFRCRYVSPGSNRECGRGTIPGTSRCRDHGGALIDEKTRRAVLMGAYLGLVDASDLAVSTLADVAANGRNELARVQAARELLDRAGLTADLNISVRIEGDERTARIEQLQTRLDTMGSALRHRVAGAIEATAHDGEPAVETPGHDTSSSPADPATP